MVPSDADRIADMAQVGRGLVDRVEKLQGSVEENTRQVAANTDELADYRKRVANRALAAFLAWILLCAGVISWIFIRVDNLIGQVLCPYFSIVVGSYDPKSRPEGEARQLYIEQFEKIKFIYYEQLGCPDQPVPPRSTPMGLMVARDAPGT